MLAPLSINKNLISRAVFVILILGAILRIHNINKYDLWFDEQCSDIYSAQRVASIIKSDSAPTYIYRASYDAHSPLYYLSVYAYSSVFGGGKSLRVISLIFSLLSLVVFYKLSRLILKQSKSLAALALMAFSPFQIWYAQEARAYTMALFFVLLAAYFYLEAIRFNRPLYWVLFTLSAVFALYSSYYSVFLIIVSGLMLFSRNNRRCIKGWLLSILAITLFLLPLTLLFIQHYSYIKGGFWLLKPKITDIFITFAAFNLGYSAGYIGLLSGSILFFTLFIYGAYSLYKTNKEYSVMLFLFVFLPVLAAYFFSICCTSVYVIRQFFIFSPFYYILIAKGLGNIRNKLFKGLAVILVALVLASSLYNYYRGFMLSSKGEREFYPGVHQKKVYSDLLTVIENNFKDGDFIAVTDIQSHAIYNGHYFARHDFISFDDFDLHLGHFLFYPVSLTELDRGYMRIGALLDALPKQERRRLYFLKYIKCYPTQDNKLPFRRFNNRAVEIFPLEKSRFKRIWLISSWWDEQNHLTHNSILVRNTLLKYFKRQMFFTKDNIRIELYIK